MTTDLSAIWDEHVRAEFEVKDADAAVATMCDDASLLHVPVATGARGIDALRRFYADVFIPSWPDDTDVTEVSRTVSDDRVVNELVVRATHDRAMTFMLPGVEPTGRRFELAHVAVVDFRDGKISAERIYWDQASLLVQLGLLPAESAPMLGVAQTRAYEDPTYPLNQLIEDSQ
jgi:carboxymethylenebutenolidase